MRLFLIRHAPTDETGDILTGRMTGVGLSAAGRASATERAAQLSRLSVDALYSSPILRCRQTARILGATWGMEPVPAPGFTEADFGSWSGQRLEALTRLKAWQRLMDAPSRFRFPDGESFADIHRRVVAATESMAEQHRAGRVAVVTHADVIRVLVGFYAGAPVDMLHRLEARPLSASVIDLPAAGGLPRVPVVNALDELAGY